MSTKLYVGNLAYTTMEDSIRSQFEQAGTVLSCEIILDKVTGKSRGFAFVEMSSEEEAQEAVDKFNDFELEGRKLVVNVARPRESRSFGGFGGGPGGGFGGGRGGGESRGGPGGKRKSGKGSRRNARNAKRNRKACW